MAWVNFISLLLLIQLVLLLWLWCFYCLRLHFFVYILFVKTIATATATTAQVDLYKVLGCPRGELSSEKEIKTAYRKGALKWHPDRHAAAGKVAKDAAEKKFKEISDAYDVS